MIVSGQPPVPNWARSLVTILVCLFPILAAVVEHAASAIFTVLGILGLIYSWREIFALDKREKILIGLLLLAFLSALLSFVNSEDISQSVSRLERLLRLIFFIPIYFLFKQASAQLTEWFCSACLVAAFVMFTVASVQVSGGGAAQGAYNSILFGDFAATLTLILLVAAFFSAKSIAYRATAFLCSLFAFQAMIYSGTRGSWLAIPIGAMVVFIFYLLTDGSSLRKRLMAVSIVTLFIGSLAFQDSRVTDRLSDAAQGFVGYVEGTSFYNSIGLRFQMWESAIEMWKINPILGSGLGDYSVDLKRMMESGASAIEAHFGEAHSLYFEALATTGLFGFITLLIAIFIYPAYIFFKNGLRAESFGVLLPRVGGIIVILAFMVFGISQNWLSRSSITSAYFLFLALFLAESRR